MAKNKKTGASKNEPQGQGSSSKASKKAADTNTNGVSQGSKKKTIPKSSNSNTVQSSNRSQQQTKSQRQQTKAKAKTSSSSPVGILLGFCIVSLAVAGVGIYLSEDARIMAGKVYKDNVEPLAVKIRQLIKDNSESQPAQEPKDSHSDIPNVEEQNIKEEMERQEQKWKENERKEEIERQQKEKEELERKKQERKVKEERERREREERKAEEERKRKETEEAERKAEQERRKEKERKEEEERKRKEKEAQRKAEQERRDKEKKEEEERKRKEKEEADKKAEQERRENEKKKEEERKKKEKEEADKKAEQERRENEKKKEEERKRKEKEEADKKAEQERREKEEEERKKKEKAEADKKAKQERRENEKQEEEERKRKEKEEADKKAEQGRREKEKKEEEERKRKEKVETDKKPEQERKENEKKKEEERKRKEKEEQVQQENKRKEVEERQRKEKEAADRKAELERQEKDRKVEEEQRRKYWEENEKQIEQERKEKERKEVVERKRKEKDEVDKKAEEERKAKEKKEAKELYEFASITNANDFKVKDDLDMADRLYDEDDYEGAIRMYDSVLKRAHLSPRAMYGKGLTLDKLGFKHMSNEYLEQAINFLGRFLLLPDVPDELFLMGGRKLAERQHFRGWGSKAVKTFTLMLERFPEDVKLRCEMGVSHMLVGRNDQAQDVFEQVLQLDPNSGFAKAHLGFIFKIRDNNLEKAVPLLRDGIASREEGTIDGRFYVQLGDALLRLGQEKEARHYFKEAEDNGLFLSQWQRSLYNVKELTARPFWTQKQLGYEKYIQLLEKNWKMIRDEGLAQMDEKDGSFMPEEENLRDTGEWKQFTLYQQGRKNTENCAKAPKTCAIIDQMPPAKDCKRGQVKFSVMSPGIHVWPHTGPTNCRLRSHLGLVVPEGPVLRVVNETRTWTEGKVMIFDDSFEHEVWHKGSQWRLILIVDFWHPELTERDRRTLSPI